MGTRGDRPTPAPPLSDEHELKRAIETIKLRAPIEDIVRERIPELRKSGDRWWACCPFHEEDTPSFSVSASLGLWYCFGACSQGGDQISFLQRLDNLSFFEVLEILAARTGVELPRKRRRDRDRGEDPAREALDLADRFYQSRLHSPEGRRALEYVRGRGLVPETLEAFGVGYAPANGRALVELARERGLDLRPFEAAGLVRTNDSGRPYDFFRGRLTIPIRDHEGRTVGFGARRLDEGEGSGPKYVNTPETPYFHKGRLIYGLDRALDAVRRARHMVLVEGYTDVMAAHQAGLVNVCAVLGTSTTDDHAALVRRSGARRVSLVFDGDAAGRAAALKALHGLLPLGADLDVVVLASGRDPADVVTEGGGEALSAQLELGADWFDFVVAGLRGSRGAELAREVDRALELFERVPKPVHRESLLSQLASAIGVPLAALREQRGMLGARRRRVEPEPAPRPAPAADPVDPAELRAFRGIVGAVLVDPSLLPLARPVAEHCRDPHLSAVLAALADLYGDEDAELDATSVVVRLGDHPARDAVAGLLEYASAAEDPKNLLDGELDFLRRRAIEREKRALVERIRAEGDEAVRPLMTRLSEVSKRGTPQPL